MANLSDVQRDQLRQVLHNRELELQDEIHDNLDRSGEPRYIAMEPICDDSVASMLADIDIAITDRAVHEIREIEASLKRLSEINFGDCTDCGDEIGFTRLLSYPTAHRCTPCQVRY